MEISIKNRNDNGSLNSWGRKTVGIANIPVVGKYRICKWHFAVIRSIRIKHEAWRLGKITFVLGVFVYHFKILLCTKWLKTGYCIIVFLGQFSGSWGEYCKNWRFVYFWIVSSFVEIFVSFIFLIQSLHWYLMYCFFSYYYLCKNILFMTDSQVMKKLIMKNTTNICKVFSCSFLLSASWYLLYLHVIFFLIEHYKSMDFGSPSTKEGAVLHATAFLIYCSLHHPNNSLQKKMIDLPHSTQCQLTDFLQEFVDVPKSSITRELVFSKVSEICKYFIYFFLFLCFCCSENDLNLVIFRISIFSYFS